MDYIIIEVPDMNDSMSRVVLNGTAYLIRFTWNDTGAYWKFGLYDSQNQPIVIGVMTRQERIGRSDFADGKAQFIFCPVEMEN